MIRYLLLLLLPLTLFGQSQKISDMTSATSLTGSEYVPIVQSTNKKATVGLLRGWTSLGTAGQLLKVNSGATALEFFTPSYLTSVGTGVANELTYWSGTNTLGSLATATYPSLTELSYVKGLTSAAQTQLGTRWPNTGSLSLTGTVNITGSQELNLGTYTSPLYANYSAATAYIQQLVKATSDNSTLLNASGFQISLNNPASVFKFIGTSAPSVGHVWTASNVDGTGYWAAPSGGGSWGSITGTLSSQTDLQTALDDKFSLTNGGTLAGASVLLDGYGNTFTINNVDVFTLGATSSLDFDAPAFTFANGPVSFEAGTTSYSSLKIPHGVAPTSPVDGDLWSTTSGFFGRVNGSTVGPFGTGGGLTIGTTTITSGTNTRVLYNNSGVLGEYTVSGSGNVAMTTSPTFTTPILGTPTSGTLTNTTGYLFNNLAAATGANTINNAANAQQWQWNTLGAGTGLLLSSSSTAAASNTQTILGISASGANATSSQTTYGLDVSNVHTGTTSTNTAARFTATGGTTNNALNIAGGNVLLTQSANQSILKSGGTLTLGVSDFNTLSLAVQNTNRIVINGSSGAFTFTTNTVTSGSVTPYTFNDLARTNQTASTETHFVNWTPNTTQFATGAQSTLRAYRMNPATYSFVGPSTITDAYTLWVDDAVASTNATITNNWAAGFGGNTITTGNATINGTLTVGSSYTTQGQIIQNVGLTGSDVYRRNVEWTPVTASGSSGNFDFNIFNTDAIQNSTCTVTITVTGVNSSGVKSYAKEMKATFRKPGTSDPVQVGSTTDIYEHSNDLTTPTSSVSASTDYCRVSYDSGTGAPTLQWTVFIETKYSTN